LLKVVTQRCLEYDLNPRPTDRKSNALTVALLRHPLYGMLCAKSPAISCFLASVVHFELKGNCLFLSVLKSCRKE